MPAETASRAQQVCYAPLSEDAAACLAQVAFASPEPFLLSEVHSGLLLQLSSTESAQWDEILVLALAGRQAGSAQHQVTFAERGKQWDKHLQSIVQLHWLQILLWHLHPLLCRCWLHLDCGCSGRNDQTHLTIASNACWCPEGMFRTPRRNLCDTQWAKERTKDTMPAEAPTGELTLNNLPHDASWSWNKDKAELRA